MRTLHPLAVISLSFLLGAALTACSGDTTLRTAPPPGAEEADPSRGGRGGGGGWPGLPELPSGPWSDIDPGDMPDVHFVVAYGDPGCCYNCDGLYGDTDDENGFSVPWDGAFGECAVSYALVDLHGQVIDEFEPPALNPGIVFSHIDLLPSGPGRFLATTQAWGTNYWPEEGTEWPEEEWGGYGWAPWIGWEFDAVQGTSSLVGYQDPVDYKVVVPGTGKRLDVGLYGVNAAVDPEDPEWLYLHGARYGCQEAPLPLRATHRTDAAVLDRFWGADELLGDELGHINWAPTSFAASIDEDGLAHVGLGFADQGCSGSEQPVHVFTDFVPDEGTSWVRVSSEPWAVNPASWAPWNGGAAVQVESPWELPTWHVVDDKGDRSGPVPDLTYNVRPGPMLDPGGPTFMLVGGDLASPVTDRMVVMHDGQQVWSIDALRFGLQEREVAILDVVVLPPLVEEDVPPQD
ncbi:MAG: hypothetical protein KDA24_14255 [Deltaproteobacteria bacterium]|nr:hypothetical protein [Deltaproteobacteria bacterium]